MKIREVLAECDLTATGIFSTVEDVLGIRLGEAEGTSEAAAPTLEEARLPNLRSMTPVLVKKQVIHSSVGKPINIVRLGYRGTDTNFESGWCGSPGDISAEGCRPPIPCDCRGSPEPSQGGKTYDYRYSRSHF